MLSRLIKLIYCAYIGPVRPAVCPRVAAAVLAGEAVGRAILHDLDVAETLAVLQEQIEGLTLDILDVRTNELPLRLQRHTTGVLSRWVRLLRMITHGMTSYHQDH